MLIEAKSYSAPRPTKWTLFKRKFLPWQIIRFLIINFRMTIMIVKSHGHRVRPETRKEK
jgi:hypothetical protein